MHKILIVEDEVNIRETLVEILESYGYEVFQSGDGLNGSIKTIKIRPDLIICDVNMPKMTGFEMIESLKESMTDELLPPYIFLTARTSSDDFRKGMNMGADDYLTKPFEIKELIESVDLKLAKRNEEKQKIKARERIKISRIIHDHVQSMMVASLMGLERVKKNMTCLDAKTEAIFQTSIEMVRQASNDLRRLSHEIGENELVDDIEKALRELTEKIEDASSVHFNISCNLENPLDSVTQTHLFYISQEAINNSLKHAEASKITLMLNSDKKELKLSIADDGKGFDPESTPNGHGFANLNKRAAELGGQIKINSAIDQGTSVEISLPAII